MRQFVQMLPKGEPTGPRVIPGVVVGTVTNNKDDEGLNRVAVKLPGLNDGVVILARMASPMAGNDRGLYVLPEEGDEVLIAFEQGDGGSPFVVGALWNGKDKSPVDNADGNNNLRVFKSRSGFQLIFNDDPKKPTFTIVDGKGNNKIVIDTKNDTISITSDQGDIRLTAPNGTVKISAQTIDLHASGDGSFTTDGKTTVHAKKNLDLKGDQTVNIN